MANRDCSPAVFAKRAWLKSLAAALIAGLALGTGALAAGAPSKGDTAQTDEALVAATRFAAGDIGYLVVDVADKRVVAERNADRPFIPASVAKIAAIAPALTILGADHRFTTTIAAEGEIADGVLKGSLTLRGGGDPSLTGDHLRAMAKQLAATGIKGVDGRFFYDASTTIELPQIDSLQPDAADYNCGVSALSLNLNRVRLKWQKVGAERAPTVAAVSRNLTVPLDRVSVAFAGENLPGPFVRSGPPAEDRWLLSPNLPSRGEDWLPVGNPSLIAADAFRAAAALEGIALPEPSPGVTPQGAREVVRHDSVPLADIAGEVLRYSNNLSAELIGLAASRAVSGRKLSLAESGSALADWWRQRLPAADWNGLVLANHSGLSTKSRATPRQIVAMLAEAARLPGGADFHDLLHPIAWKGAKGSAHAKTGTMSFVRGLAGYIDTAAGHRLAFAIFFNDAEKRAALEAAFDPHVRAIDARSRSWRNRAVTLERKLATGWAGRF